MTPEEQFRDAIASAGLTPPDVIEPGKLCRFSTNSKRTDDAGWCKLFTDLAGGVFGDHRTGFQETWQAERELPYTAEERHAFRKRCEAERRARQAEEKKRHDEAATRSRVLLDGARGDPKTHSYTVGKRGQIGKLAKRGPWPQRGWDDALLFPLYGPDGQISTLEAINCEGDKDFLAGGKKSGCFHPFGRVRGAAEVLIGEGAANVAAAVNSTGSAGAAAMDAGNLLAVALTVRALAPEAAITMLADDDQREDGRNTGIESATAAAEAVGGRVAVPGLGRKADFWDLWAEQGPEAVRRAIAGATVPAHFETGVTRVTGVQPSNYGPSAVTPSNSVEVTGVTGQGTPRIPGAKERPAFRVFDGRLEHGGQKFRPGVWHFGTDKDGNPTQVLVCSPLHVEAVTYDAQDNNFGRLLRFKNTLGRWREWAMPMDLLRGGGDDLRGELLAMGVEIATGTQARNLLATFLQAKPPERRMRCALQVGWCDGSFVLPDTVIGPRSSGVIFQSGERGHDEYTRSGTLEGWQTEISARAVDNPLLVLALSASFAGPMLGRCNAEGGGIHFVGDSSTGKTTAIEAACSTWGGPNYRRSWRATANGMEGAAALFNDALLALDEISECDPREVGAIVYALGNGRGKQRASRTGSARGVVRWRCMVLSSGERTIGTAMQEGGRRAKAGQAVRLLDLLASRKHGIWDELHGMTSAAALSDAIKRATTTHHGHAGRAFLERLTRDERDFCALLERIKALPKFAADGGEGQDKRAAGRFALLALAGEVATEYELTGWPEGEAIKAAEEGFKAWRALRGRGNDERRQILERVSAFIDRHGDSRFSDSADSREVPTRERAGWWRDASGGREYLFNADGMREALTGFDFTRALNVLQAAEALPHPGEDGKRAAVYRIGGRTMRLYAINPDKLGGDHGA